MVKSEEIIAKYEMFYAAVYFILLVQYIIQRG